MVSVDRVIGCGPTGYRRPVSTGALVASSNGWGGQTPEKKLEPSSVPDICRTDTGLRRARVRQHHRTMPETLFHGIKSTSNGVHRGGPGAVNSGKCADDPVNFVNFAQESGRDIRAVTNQLPCGEDQ